MKEEIWRKVKGFEDYYEVSNTGKVRSISREIKRGNKGNYFQEGKELTLSLNNKGYCIAKLWVNGKGKKYFVHRLVAEAFIDNPKKYPVINHKDENPLNNNVENLEWCTQKYNVNYGTARERIKEKLVKPIYQLDKQTKEIIKEWNNANEVAKYFNCSRGRIFGWCQDYAEAEGYIWCYVEDYENGYNGNVIKSINLNRCVYKINPVDLSVIAEYPNISSTVMDGFDCGSVSNCCRGKAKKHKGFYWCYVEDYEKLDINNLKHHKSSKGVIQYDLRTNDIINKWDSMTEMYNKGGYAITLVGKCCKGIINNAYGYGWRYAD